MVSFSIPSLSLNRFELKANPLGDLIDKAERTSGHVVQSEEGKYSVVSDMEVSFRKLQPIYSFGVGFNYNQSGVHDTHQQALNPL